jgi:hypothetical protein
VSTTIITVYTILEIKSVQDNIKCTCFKCTLNVKKSLVTSHDQQVTSQADLATDATTAIVVPSSAKYMHCPNNSKHWKRRELVNTSTGSFSDTFGFQCEIMCTTITVFLPQRADDEVQKLLCMISFAHEYQASVRKRHTCKGAQDIHKTSFKLQFL